MADSARAIVGKSGSGKFGAVGQFGVGADAIEAKSDEEEVSNEFVFLLPFVNNVGEVSDSENGQTSEVVPFAPRRILVVEDNVDAADSLAQLREMLGKEVRTGHDAEAGIALADQFRPDVVLMDMGMPKSMDTRPPAALGNTRRAKAWR